MKRRISFLLFAVAISFASMGQPRNPGASDSDDNSNNDVDAAPISGIELLIAAGGLLGAKRIFSNRKKSS